MNNDVNQNTTSNSQLSTTQNPQDVGTPSLTPMSSGIQSSSNNLFSNTNLTISDVNGTPITLSQTNAKTVVHATPPPSFSARPYFITGAIVLVVLASFIMVAIGRGAKTSKS